MGSFEDSSAMEQALQMISDCMIELVQPFEVAKQVAASDFKFDPLIGDPTVPVTAEREGVDKGVKSLKRLVTGFIHPAGREAHNVSRSRRRRHRWGTSGTLIYES